MPRWCWRWRRGGGRGRPPVPIYLGIPPQTKRFEAIPCLNPNPIELTPPELEALRLVDLEGLTQEEAAKRMGVSRGTLWRLLKSAREKTARALVESRSIIVSSAGGLNQT